MKITGLKCATIGNHLILRITTDEGVDGFSQAEHAKPYLKDPILRLEEFVIGKDPTDVERVVRGIRQRGAAKPWGTPVSMIEMALWDIAGKSAGLPVYKLLGGKVRDRVLVYNGAIRQPLETYTPEGFAAIGAWMRELPQGFKFVKQGIAYHGDMKRVPGFLVGDMLSEFFHGWPVAGTLSEKGIAHVVDCVTAMREALGPDIGLALDCGPGFSIPDAIRLARALELLDPMWMEDLLTGDYTPWPGADLYREVTTQTTIPIHTGEQLYLRQSFKELIEGKAVNIVGPDPCDVGGIAELKWIAEYADLHGILMAPHGTGDGLFWPRRSGSGERDYARELHRIRIADRRSCLVVRYRRRLARPAGGKRFDRSLGPSRNRYRIPGRRGSAISGRRRTRFLRQLSENDE